MVQNRDEWSSETLSKLRSMDLFSRSRSNQYLSESERLQMNALLSEGETELAKLHDTIEAVSTERDDLECHIQCAKSLSAPICKIPPEILSEIFIEHGTLNNISESADIPGFKLAHVSSYWRSVAFSTPALWNEILIKTSNPFFYARHVSLIQDILPRSFGSPLHICITATPDQDFPHFDRLHPAVPFLFEHVARWQYLRIIDRSSDGFQPSILEDLSPIQGRLTGLTNFVSSSNEYTSLLGNATNLRAVAVGSFKFTHAACPWANINQFQVRSSQISQIVQALPHVAEECVVHVQNPLRSDDHGETSPPIVYYNVVHLIITMGNNLTEETAAEELLDMLMLPNLTSLAFVNEKALAIRSKRPGHRWSATSIPSLLNRSNAPLTELSLIRTWIPVEILLDLLNNLLTLRTLRIEEPADAPSHAPMLTADFFKHLNAYRDGKPLVPELCSLILGVNLLSPDLQWLFAGVVESRHWPVSHTLPPTKRVSRLDSVGLTLRKGTMDERIVSLLMSARRDGLRVSVIDAKGDIMVRGWKE